MTTERELALSLYHESVEPYAYAENGDLVVRLRVGAGLIERVQVRHADKFVAEQITVCDAAWYATDGPAHEVYQAVLRRDSKRFKYYFAITPLQTTEPSFYSRAGFSLEQPSLDDAFEVPYLGERDNYQPPEWSAGAVYYQIFPERFARSKRRENALALGESDHSQPLVAWDAIPTRDNFLGGDLDGIGEHLSHMIDIGADVVYLTPVFAAPSNHKYDTVDYLRIDPDFGDQQALGRLSDACHERGLRVVIDAVFNHMGARHPYFLDLLQKGQASPYKDYVYALGWPLSLAERNYETFGTVANMPKWRTATPAVEDYLCHIGEYWLDFGQVDGWRLDVSDEVEHAFWRTFRKRIKATREDALIVGEIWQIATPWLRGDQFDSVMNYPFARAALDWLARRKGDAQTFAARIDQLRALYPEPVLPYLWTLLDSHDTPRLLTECKGDKARLRLISFLQFTFTGSPLVYYGDEVGMVGGGDPLCRAGMVWDEQLQDGDLLAHYRALGKLRKQYISLRSGRLREVLRNQRKQLYAFVRYVADAADNAPGSGGQEVTLCIINGGSRPLTIKLFDAQLPSGSYECIYGFAAGNVVQFGDNLKLPAYSGTLWRWKESV